MSFGLCDAARCGESTNYDCFCGKTCNVCFSPRENPLYQVYIDSRPNYTHYPARWRPDYGQILCTLREQMSLACQAGAIIIIYKLYLNLATLM